MENNVKDLEAALEDLTSDYNELQDEHEVLKTDLEDLRESIASLQEDLLERDTRIIDILRCLENYESSTDALLDNIKFDIKQFR